MISSKKVEVSKKRKTPADPTEDSVIEAAKNREDYLKEKAKNVTMPTLEKAVLVPKHVYAESGPLIINVCRDCRTFNAAREMQVIDEERQQLPFALCQICRASLNDLHLDSSISTYPTSRENMDCNH